ncbi:MAG TPA: YqaA family protein [Candidatus Saccharimonadales bacterium]
MATAKLTPIKRLYRWFEARADRPNADRALFGFSFIEAIIFPIPPDPLLMAMIFSRPQRWLRLVLITIGASLLGGIFGYILGVGLFETIGQWLIETFNLQAGFNELGQRYQEGAFVVVLTAAFTPIPFKLVTLTAGAFSINFVVFILGALLGRSLRFFGLGYLARYLGENHKTKIEKYIDIVSFMAIALILLALLLV